MATQQLEPADLVKRAVKLIKSYNAAVDTVDVHIARTLGPEPGLGDAPRVGAINNEDWQFLQQVFYGAERMDRALRIFLNAFYHVKAAAANRADYHMYKVMAYLLLFRLRELGPRKLIPLLEGQDATKMHHLVGLALDKANMDMWVMEGWCHILDRTYIENEILAVLEEHRPRLQGWLDKTYAQAFGASGRGSEATHAQARTGAAEAGEAGTLAERETRSGSQVSMSMMSSTWKPTVPVAPRLTQPRGRLPPEPVRIAQYIKAGPLPAYLDAPGHSLGDIDAAAETRSKAVADATAAKYAGAKGQGPALHALNETRKTVDRIRAEVEAAREAACVMPAELRYRPPPVLPSDGADVAYTVAAILREDASARAKTAKEVALLKSFEAGLRDSAEYYAWQASERIKDEGARLAAVEARKVDAREGAAKTAQALERRERGNKQVAQAVRASVHIATEHLKEEREGVAIANAAIASQVRAGEYVLPKKAQAAIVVRKREAVEAARVELQDAEMELAAGKEVAALARAEVIRQIRALERVPTPHIKHIDHSQPGASSAYTLEAMSIVELRERMVIAKARCAQDREERRRSILRAKREGQEVLLAKVSAMRNRRLEAVTRARADRESKEVEAAAEEESREVARERAVLAMHDKLEARAATRAAERSALAALHERTATEAAFRGGTHYALEGVRLGQALAAAERAVLYSQDAALARARESEQAAARAREDASVRAAFAEAEEAGSDKARALALMHASAEERAFRVSDGTARKSRFFEQTVQSQALLDARDALNPYAGRVRAVEIGEARERRRAVDRPAQDADKLRRRIERLPPGHPLTPNLMLKLAQARSKGGQGGMTLAMA